MKSCVPAFLIGVWIAPAGAFAQTCTVAEAGSCTVSASVSLTATSLVWAQISSSTTALKAPTPADFTAGFNSSAGPTLTLASNGPWSVHIRGATAVWSASGPLARVNKPVGDLKWSIASNGVFSAVSTSDATMRSGVASGDNIVTIFFQTVYNWRFDTPGLYSLSIVLTLTSP